MRTFLLSHKMMNASASLVAALFLLAGCSGDNTAAQGTTVSTTAQAAAPAQTAPALQPKGQPQPKLPVIKLWVGTNQISAEIASTLNQIRTGMMFRTNMAEMEGMLFVFPEPQQVAFYMKNTLIPLSCAYIDPEGTILETFEMKPLDETALPSKSTQVQYVLEMNKGWFDRHNIRPGVVISTERGTFPQTFARRSPR